MSNTIVPGVFLLEPGGPSTLLSRGWRGRELEGVNANASPHDIAVEATRSCGAPLEVHAIVKAPERTWIVLRAPTSYNSELAASALRRVPA